MNTSPFRLLGIALVSVFLFSVSSVALAQRTGEVGSEEERLRRPKILEVPERAVIPIEIPPEEELPAGAAGAADIQVVAVQVEGATVLPKGEEEALTSRVMNKTVSLQDLRVLAVEITRWYRSRGYVTSRALVPAQTVEKGVVKIRVAEGKVGEIRIEGNKYFKTELIRRYVKLEQGSLLQMRQLEDALRGLNSHPDRKVKLVLVPASQPETTDVVLQVTDKRPIHASYTVDDLGTKTTGYIRQSVVFSHGNLTGGDDQLVLRGLATESGGLDGGALSYLRPLGASGLSATFDLSGVKSYVGEDLKGLDSEGDSITVSPGMVIPLVRRTNWESELTTGFDFKRVRTRQPDQIVTSKDDLRVFRFSAAVLGEDKWGRNLLVQETRVGIPNVIGGSHPEDIAASRTEAGGSFVRWVGSGVRITQVPFGGMSLVTRATGQISSDRLVPAEQLRLGGFETVRGYPEGEYLADYGYNTTIELRAPVLERFWPNSSEPSFQTRLARSLQLVGFWDFAEGFLKGSQNTEDQDSRLSGVGCGFRLRPTEESSLQADFGWPVGDRDAEKDKPRIHFICRLGF